MGWRRSVQGDEERDFVDRSGESLKDRLDRNWIELLQELRVTQTGVQILTGFLLTIPFSEGYDLLDRAQRIVYLCVLSGSVVSTALFVGPVAFHRALFRRGERPWLVSAANYCALIGLAALGLTICGVVWLAFDVVAGSIASTVATIASVVFFLSLWAGIPYVARRR